MSRFHSSNLSSLLLQAVREELARRVMRVIPHSFCGPWYVLMPSTGHYACAGHLQRVSIPNVYQLPGRNSIKRKWGHLKCYLCTLQSGGPQILCAKSSMADGGAASCFVKMRMGEGLP